MSQSIVLDKAIKFALRIVGLYKYLTEREDVSLCSRSRSLFRARLSLSM